MYSITAKLIDRNLFNGTFTWTGASRDGARERFNRFENIFKWVFEVVYPFDSSLTLQTVKAFFQHCVCKCGKRRSKLQQVRRSTGRMGFVRKPNKPKTSTDEVVPNKNILPEIPSWKTAEESPVDLEYLEEPFADGNYDAYASESNGNDESGDDGEYGGDDIATESVGDVNGESCESDYDGDGEPPANDDEELIIKCEERNDPDAIAATPNASKKKTQA